jgi:hypothetical protein
MEFLVPLSSIGACYGAKFAILDLCGGLHCGVGGAERGG